MNIREWIADNIGYRFLGCAYTKQHDKIFESLIDIIPTEFKNKEISDLGCGDGSNTIRIKNIFKAMKIVGYERNIFLIKKARMRGLKVMNWDLNNGIPKGEMAVFSFAFHHIRNKDKITVLKKVKKHFKYIFLIEPMRDLYHALFDAGYPLSKKKWIKVFDMALGKYILYEQGNNLIVFYQAV